ncbi:unnamed protein product (macronuclear) [Paramecium tetraurelia]|uniref:3'(2'),5'-bisphosphate nucleotidase n=1 Tax=Paramecium tetraurelia TaxID=5888 RepID=A0EII2_PARTE|nr:uncharacterized protein GSPATT00027452001 [Paramecium tetraurelia]CAK95123.1 unnamed protein product [Paramecium tetraurelia]|eukprot:XP_001462496.1 hypothetical protein (macronuclear) [Paramecium tetraurelia strain d4-2]
MLKVHEFFSVAIQLAYNSAKIINSVRLSKDIGQKWKGVDDPVTIADIQAQTYIVQQLHRHWPKLTIIGEESISYSQPIDLPDTQLQLYDEDIFNKTHDNHLIRTQYEIDDLCVWVDPLDGTLDFVKGDYENVTTLIGVSYKKQALMGIISQPFIKVQEPQNSHEFKPKIYFGHHPQQRVFYTSDCSSKIPQELKKPQFDPSNVRLCTQRNRLSNQELQKIKSLGCQLYQMGGSGKKSLTVLEGETDMFICLGVGMSKWDICAPEALFKTFGGDFVGLAGQHYEYNPKDKSFDNPYGNLSSIHSELLQKYLPKTYGML